MPKRVAVVVIHGVADQERCSSARAAADLLRNASGEWGDFVEDEVRVKVEAVRVEDAAPGPTPETWWDVTTWHAWRQSPRPGENELPEDCYMREQLSVWQPKGEGSVYRTVRLRSTHRATGTETSVYEMHWADLSSVSSAVGRAFAEAYQLMFLLASVGRWTVEQERPAGRAGWLWQCFYLLQATAEWFLVQAVLPLNLLLLACILPLVALCHTPVEAMRPVMAGLGALLPAVAIVAGRGEKNGRGWPENLWWAAGFGAATGGGAWWGSGLAAIPVVFNWVVFAICVAGVYAIVNTYNKRFPGAVLVFAALLYTLWDAARKVDWWAFVPPAPSHVLGYAAAPAGHMWRLSNLVLNTLHTTWTVTIGATMLCAVAGFVLIGTDRHRARAAWTSLATLALSITLIFCLNIGAWQAAIGTIAKLTPAFHGTSEVLAAYVQPNEGFAPVELKEADWVPVGKLLDQGLGRESGTPLLAAVALLLAVVVVTWNLLPAIFAEGGARERGSVWLGETLTAAFSAMRLPVWVLYVGLIAVAALDSRMNEWVEVSRRWTAVFGILVVGMLLGRGPLEFVGSTSRKVLDVVLDVVNWLRIYPLEDNVRAKICGRYVSLLRHILQNDRYDRVVILAHSQGTVITADLLRFLDRYGRAETNGVSALRTVPIWVFSMGCPLRQLYGQRFPGLYGWARRGDWRKTLLGSPRWINAYAAGDYVGRNLWSGTPEKLWTPMDEVVDRVRKGEREFCIGEGAHLGYWEPEQVAIREVLQAMVLGTADGVAISAKAT